MKKDVYGCDLESERRKIINYDKLPNYIKEASDGEKAKNHGIACGGKCCVFYVEDGWYSVECENCGTLAYFKSKSNDWAIKIWNDLPDAIGYPPFRRNQK